MMQTRDAGILLLSILLLWLLFAQEGSVQIEPGWRIPISVRGYRNHHFPSPAEVLPPPVAQDFDGDGYPELVLVTREPAVEVYQYRSRIPRSDRVRAAASASSDIFLRWLEENRNRAEDGEGPDELVLLRKRVLLKAQSQEDGGLSWQPVQLAVGSILSPDGEKSESVVVVLTEGFQVLCLDLDLEVLWHHSLLPATEEARGPALRRIAEPMISILPQSLQKPELGGWGAVIVGARLQQQQSGGEPEGHGGHAQHTKTLLRTPHLRSKSSSTQPSASRLLFKALDGKTGRELWMHDSGDSGVSNEGFRFDDLSVPEAEGEAAGEAENPGRHLFRAGIDSGSTGLMWKNFRQSLFRGPRPNFLIPPSNQSHSPSVASQGFVRIPMMTEGGGGSHLRHSDETPGVFPHVWAMQGDSGIRIRHLDREEHLQQSELGSHEHAGELGADDPTVDDAPNSVIAHLEDGIYALHLYSGRLLFQMPLESRVVHVDLQGDDRLDQVRAFNQEESRWMGTDSTGAGEDDADSENARRRRHAGQRIRCLGQAVTGDASPEVLFSTDICPEHHGFRRSSRRRRRSRMRRRQSETAAEGSSPEHPSSGDDHDHHREHASQDANQPYRDESWHGRRGQRSESVAVAAVMESPSRGPMGWRRRKEQFQSMVTLPEQQDTPDRRSTAGDYPSRPRSSGRFDSIFFSSRGAVTSVTTTAKPQTIRTRPKRSAEGSDAEPITVSTHGSLRWQTHSSCIWMHGGTDQEGSTADLTPWIGSGVVQASVTPLASQNLIVLTTPTRVCVLDAVTGRELAALDTQDARYQVIRKVMHRTSEGFGFIDDNIPDTDVRPGTEGAVESGGKQGAVSSLLRKKLQQPPQEDSGIAPPASEAHRGGDRETFPPVIIGRPILTDWDGNGVEDIIVVTQSAYLGLRIQRGLMSSSVTTVVALIMLLAVLVSYIARFCFRSSESSAASLRFSAKPD